MMGIKGIYLPYPLQCVFFLICVLYLVGIALHLESLALVKLLSCMDIVQIDISVRGKHWKFLCHHFAEFTEIFFIFLFHSVIKPTL